MSRITSLPYSQFTRNLEFVSSRVDDTGFTRIWGYFVDRSNRIIVFWRWKVGRFTFKISDTYQGNLTVSDKVREKGIRGYKEIEGEALDKAEALLRSIHHDFLDAKERGLFHAA